MHSMPTLWQTALQTHKISNFLNRLNYNIWHVTYTSAVKNLNHIHIFILCRVPILSSDWLITVKDRHVFTYVWRHQRSIIQVLRTSLMTFQWRSRTFAVGQAILIKQCFSLYLSRLRNEHVILPCWYMTSSLAWQSQCVVVWRHNCNQLPFYSEKFYATKCWLILHPTRF